MSATVDERQVTVVFRFDDYARFSSKVGTELLRIFQQHRVPCTYGVIPYTSREFSADPASCIAIDPGTTAKLLDVARSGLVEVALHGFTHNKNSAERGRPNGSSEFRGLDYPSQLRMLSAGRGTLEDLCQAGVTTFIPPWNSYDDSTLRALDSLGFEVLSASTGAHDVAWGGRSPNIRFLPFTCGLDALQQAVGFARRTSDPCSVIVVLLHPYDFVEYDDGQGKFTYQTLDDNLSWLAVQSDVITQTLGEAALKAKDIGSRRLRASIGLERSQKTAPAFLRTKGSVLLYPSTRYAHRIRAAAWGRLVLFYLSLTVVMAALAGTAAGFLLSNVRLGSLPRIAEFATAGLLGLYVVYAFAVRLRHAFRHRHMMVLAGLLGTTIGTWGAAYARGMMIPGK